VPAAFAAIVRKLMAKNPADRHQTGAELRTDLARWADPKTALALLGSGAEPPRDFRPPPPDLDDDDLRLLGEDESGSLAGAALRELGEAEPETARRGRDPSPEARRAVPIVSPTLPPAYRSSWNDDVPWLIPFIVVVCALGVLAVALIFALGG
jgi:serine/threonine-protein kinase